MKHLGLSTRVRVWLSVVLIGLLTLVLSGCGPIGATLDTQTALRNAGYQSVSVTFSVGNSDEVKTSVTVNAVPSEGNARDVASIVWQKFHERFSLLAVTVHGSGPALARGYSYAELVSLFGPRNPAYDRTSLSSATARLGVIIIVVLVVLAAAVVFVIVMVTRRRRRRPPTWPGGGPPWMQGGPPPGGGPPWVQGGPAPGGGRWQPGGPPPPQGGAQPPASFPLWPPPQGPPPGRPSGEPPPAESEPPGEQAPAWPPAPSPPPTRD